MKMELVTARLLITVFLVASWQRGASIAKSRSARTFARWRTNWIAPSLLTTIRS